MSSNTLCETFHKRLPVKQDSTTKQVHSAVNDGWMHGGSFVSSVVAGMLLGYFADMWLGTEPWLVAIGLLAGSYAGFVKMWGYLKEMDEEPVRE